MADHPGATSAPDTSDEPSRSERLDRLPFTRRHLRLLTGSGIGWALDAMDVGMISFVIAALAREWQLSDPEISLALSMGFAGMAIGASFGGLLADKMGRRTVFALTLLVYGLATGASALTTSLALFVVLRFVVGLGLGSELPVASTLVSEFSPARIRGRVIVVLEAFWAVGWLLAALIGYFVVAEYDDGWRWAMAIGAVPAIYALYVRARIPESVRFLESRGRHDDAEAAVRQFEESPPLGRGTGTARSSAAILEPEPTPEDEHLRPGVASLFAGRLRRRTIGLWMAWFFLNFAYYGSFTWLPTILSADGGSLTKSFGYVVVITLAQLPGYAVAAILIETWGRRATLASFLVGSGLAAGLFSLAEDPWQIVGAGCLLSFFCLGAWGALYAVTPEMYPTVVRGSGAGWAAGFGRIASIVAPFAVPFFLRAGGPALAFTVFAAAFALAAVGALLLTEKRGQALE
ncbi:MFS transporter [Georgenia sp. Z1344]|uniref:MFS transporter n=1 Tax=Georgenia sp. Z1344 TaxID=3416706 RepID=UPI003CF4F3E1